MSSHTARERILGCLHASGTEATTVPAAPAPKAASLAPEERIALLAEKMTAIRTEVHVVEAGSWSEDLKRLARDRGWKRLLYGPSSPIGAEVATAWGSGPEGLPELVAYTEPVETFKEEMFAIDAGITGTRGAVADPGAVILWPGEDEPRLLSLVPPVHVAVLDADAIYDSLDDVISAQNWAGGMPTNALLISGPSKTADIEFTLVFGVHGPKELILFIRK